MLVIGKRKPENRKDGMSAIIRDNSTAASWVFVMVDTNNPILTVHKTYIRDIAIRRKTLPSKGIPNHRVPVASIKSISPNAIAPYDMIFPKIKTNGRIGET